MNAILQIVGSTVVGGLIMLLILGLNFGILNTAKTTVIQSSVQSDVANISQIIEADFNLIGYGVPSATPIFPSIDSTDISFYEDINNDGTLDLIRYYYNSSGLASTPNPNDFELFRVVNGQSYSIGSVTKFRVYTYNELGFYSKESNKIRTVKYELMIENSNPTYDEVKDSMVYSSAFITRNIKFKNPPK